MALVPAKCINCGHVLQVDNSINQFVCPCCNSMFLLEKAINHYASTTINSISGPIINFNDNSKNEYFEFKTIEVQKSSENEKINYMRMFGYILSSSTPSGVATTKLVFKRDTKMKHYSRVIELENEYQKLKKGKLPLYIISKYNTWTILFIIFELLLIFSMTFSSMVSSPEEIGLFIFAIIFFTIPIIFIIIGLQKGRKRAILENDKRVKYNNSIPIKINDIKNELYDIINSNDSNSDTNNLDL